jgi:hypothetical protein
MVSVLRLHWQWRSLVYRTPLLALLASFLEPFPQRKLESLSKTITTPLALKMIVIVSPFVILYPGLSRFWSDEHASAGEIWARIAQLK